MYVGGRVDIFDMMDIDLFIVVVLNMMVMKLGYTCKSEPMFYNYLRPLTSLDEGLYALGCEEDVRCLDILVRSFKLIEVCIEHGVTALDSYLRAPRIRETLEEINDELAGLSHDESFGVDDLDLNLNEEPDVNLNVFQVETQSEVPVSEEPDVDQEPIVAEVSTEVPIVEEIGTHEFSVEDIVVEDYVSSEKDTAQYNGEFNESARSDEQRRFLVDEENEIVEHDVDLHLFDVDIINPDGFNSDHGNDEETNYKKRMLAELRTKMEGDRPTGPNHGMKPGPSGSSGPTTRSKKKKEYREIKHCTYKFLSEKIFEQVRVDPDILVKAIQDQLQHELEGIIPAIKTVYPSAEHRYFLRHIHKNMKHGWCGQAYKDLLWRVASATNVRDFEICILELKTMNAKAHEWLNKIPADDWARSYFLGRAKSNLLLNNICEVFNVKIVRGKDKPVITLLEYIIEYYIKRIMNVQGVIDKCTGLLTPTATRIMESIKKEAHLIKELTGIPCKHADAACWNMALNDPMTPPLETWCLGGGGYLRDSVGVVDGTNDGDKGTNIMKDEVSQENMCEEEVPSNKNIGKQIGDFVDMPSEAVE
uniref:Uncharacterized protein n=1 Tax=Tanacetum cinerariifolium TaxID=118510 RepID=A0A6L2LP57_TANCI|nr:hypothetical protein [Tanacetum cinerariifolium]